MIAEGQTILDFCIEQYGTLDNLIDLIRDNELKVNSRIRSGQEVTIQTNLGDQAIKDYFRLNNIRPNNYQQSQLPPIPGGAYNNDYNIDYS